MADSRFENFTDQERAFLMIGLSAIFAEWTVGMFTGKPASMTINARDAPVMMRLMDELAEAAGVPTIDPELRGLFVHVIDQAAAKEQDER